MKQKPVTEYQNPVSFNVEGVTNPDPFVLSYLGTYYCYSTDEAGVQVSRSADLVSWEYLGLAFTETGRRAYWAPNVVYRNGLFYLYVSDRPVGEEDPHLQRLRVATSPVPEGPFTHVRYLKDYFAIDADVVFGRDGQAVLFYASNEFTEFDPDHPGTGIVAESMADMVTLVGDQHPIIVPTLREEVFEENRFGDGRDWHTIEGGAYFTRRGNGYMTYSGNAYVRENYFIGYATAAVQNGLAAATWTKYPDNTTFSPLLRRNDQVEGTGHNSVIQAPNLVDWWIIYHGRDAAEPLVEGTEQRVMRIDPLVFDGPVLKALGPSAGSSSAPRAANFQDQFKDANPALWHATGAAGSYEEDGVTLSGGAGLTLQSPVGPARFEVWVRAGEDPAALAIKLEEGEQSEEILVDTATSEIRTNAAPEQATPLGDFQWQAWQPLTVERSLAQLTVTRGEEILLQVPSSLGREPAQLSLAAATGAVQLGSFRLTETFDWWAPNPGRELVLADDATQTSLREPLPPGTELALDVEFQSGGTIRFASTAWEEPLECTGAAEGTRTFTLTHSPGLIALTCGTWKEVRQTSRTHVDLRLQLESANVTAVRQTRIS